ncbi:hypothetical protein ACQQ2N_07125 [Dokdonella sp. MW10]|uniref:hypothetical protein n=1 Tax=Dokdonella sp. MW10 TaxID=2992926 RepID=UPI003F7FE1E4
MASPRLSTYTHRARVVGMVEFMCSDDEASDRPELADLGEALARHVVAMNPRFLDRGSVDAATLASERSIANGLNDPGHLESFFGESCFLEQPFVFDLQHRVCDHAADVGRELGLVIAVSRFWRHEAGPSSSPPDLAVMA